MSATHLTSIPRAGVEPRSLSATSLAAGYGLIHALVDAACVMAIWRTGPSERIELLTGFAIVLGYDLLAFATQFPLGAVADKLGLTRAATISGVGLAILAVLLIPYSPLGTMLAAGLGNSLFHLGGGAAVLRSSHRRAAPAGIFVAPGALGLGLGTWMGKTGIGPAWPLVGLLVLGFALIEILRESAPPDARAVEGPARDTLTRPTWAVALSLLLVSVAIRSFVGFAGCRECPKGLLVLMGVPLAAFGGKLVGGLLADRLGWVATSVGALLLSAPLIAFNGGNAALAIVGLLLFQMTMPVTLVAVSLLLPGKPATAFGLPCLALILGAVPTFFPLGRQFFTAPILGSSAKTVGSIRVANGDWKC